MVDVHRRQVLDLLFGDVEPDAVGDAGDGADRNGHLLTTPEVTLLEEEAKIAGRAAMGVQVTSRHYNHTMYFDKETHLLLSGVGSDILREVTFTDYKKFDGIPIAQKERDGHFEPDVTDFRVVDKFDAKLFEQP